MKLPQALAAHDRSPPIGGAASGPRYSWHHPIRLGASARAPARDSALQFAALATCRRRTDQTARDGIASSRSAASGVRAACNEGVPLLLTVLALIIRAVVRPRGATFLFDVSITSFNERI